MKNTGITYTSAERSPVILPEMAELLPPLSAEQSAALEEDLLRNGCYSPVTVSYTHLKCRRKFFFVKWLHKKTVTLHISISRKFFSCQCRFKNDRRIFIFRQFAELLC